MSAANRAVRVGRGGEGVERRRAVCAGVSVSKGRGGGRGAPEFMSKGAQGKSTSGGRSMSAWCARERRVRRAWGVGGRTGVFEKGAIDIMRGFCDDGAMSGMLRVCGARTRTDAPEAGCDERGQGVCIARRVSCGLKSW